MNVYLSGMSRRRGRAPWSILFVSILFGLSLLFSACGSSSTDTNTSSSVTPSVNAPTGLVTAGTLTVGSDTTYPPQEFIDPASRKAAGFDVDLVTAMAQRMGLKADVKTANFTTIIDDLSAKRYDIVISALTINDERKQKADFVPYFNAGQSLLVQKGNPEKIASVQDLCGKTVGVQDGTVELDTLNAATKDCKAAGKSEIKMTILSAQTDVIQLLVNKRVVAAFQDSPVTDYYLQQNATLFEIAGSITDQAVEGIAVRKGDAAMLKAVQDAFNAVKADGTYDKLFTQWHLNPVQKVAMLDRRLQYI
jgi:polar amino acid transport system substrate-binding protein